MAPKTDDLTRAALISAVLHCVLCCFGCMNLFKPTVHNNDFLINVELAGAAEIIPSKSDYEESLPLKSSEKIEEEIIEEKVEQQTDDHDKEVIDAKTEEDLRKITEEVPVNEEALQSQEDLPKAENPTDDQVEDENQEGSSDNADETSTSQNDADNAVSQEQRMKEEEELREQARQEELKKQEELEREEELRRQAELERQEKLRRREQELRERRKKELEAIKRIETKKKGKKKRLEKISTALKKKEKDTAFDNMLKKEKSDLKKSTKKFSSKGNGSGRGNGLGSFGNGFGLTPSDAAIISSQIAPHWIVAGGVKNAETLIIRIRIKLKDNGEVIPSSLEILDTDRYNSDYVFRSAADSAKRAILEASPFKIPPDKMYLFRDFEFSFNTDRALGVRK